MIRRARFLAVGWLAAVAAIAAICFAFDAAHEPFVLASLGGSAVILFGMPDSDMAQPRAFLGGHLIATTVGIGFLKLFGTDWWVLATAMASALTLMQLTRTVHSPAGADPLIVVLNKAGWPFLLTHLALGLAILLVAALAFNNAVGTARYPRSWR